VKLVFGCFDQPFELSGGRQCRLGTTIGFALAPADASTRRCWSSAPTSRCPA
jgi:hypothetical protein